jgi:hypothetical protein
METNVTELKNTGGPKKRPVGLIYGLLAGACIVLFMTVLYKGGVDVYLGPFAWLGYIIMIGFAVAATMAEKKANGGYLEFTTALKTSFIVFVIVLAAQTLFIWLLVNHIDAHFKEVLTKAVQERTEAALKQFGFTQDKIDQAMTEERSKDQYTLGRMTLGLAFVDIIFFIISLVIAAIVKKKKVEFSDAGF